MPYKSTWIVAYLDPNRGDNAPDYGWNMWKNFISFILAADKEAENGTGWKVSGYRDFRKYIWMLSDDRIGLIRELSREEVEEKGLPFEGPEDMENRNYYVLKDKNYSLEENRVRNPFKHVYG